MFLERLGVRRGRTLQALREDFCGTAALACHWVLRSPAHTAWAVDRDGAALAWARRHHLAHIRHGAARVTLLESDVRRARTPQVDVVTAMNFSALGFHDRRTLGAYFRSAARALRPGGLLVLQTLGGPGASAHAIERRRVPASQGPDGREIPAFTYEWEQTPLGPGHLHCALYFSRTGAKRRRRAFQYEWRLWSLQELTDLLRANGFAATEFWLHDSAAPLGRRKRKAPAPGASWVGEVVARRGPARRPVHR